tara:strand:- start:100 stop:396 length:297 start_codon:yes stop_codon:yes gene_type:complete
MDEANDLFDIKFKDMVECPVSTDSSKFGLQNYNDGWFKFLKENQAYCFDQEANYSIFGNKDTKKQKVILIDINKCQDRVGQDYKCANETELDEFLKFH